MYFFSPPANAKMRSSRDDSHLLKVRAETSEVGASATIAGGRQHVTSYRQIKLKDMPLPKRACLQLTEFLATMVHRDRSTRSGRYPQFYLLLHTEKTAGEVCMTQALQDRRGVSGLCHQVGWPNLCTWVHRTEALAKPHRFTSGEPDR